VSAPVESDRPPPLVSNTAGDLLFALHGSEKKEIDMPTGTVKWFNVEKGFGFIAPQDGGNDVFVHITAVQAAGLSTLNDGQRVTYDLITERGRQAASKLRVG
jgi:CspA family cold shock protein